MILGYALYALRESSDNPGASTISISRILTEPAQIGHLFLLEREVLLKRLRELEVEGFVRVANEGGLDNISFTFSGNSLAVLEHYYQRVKQ